eukprot:TRINITY_DN10557_c0_g1_i1.p1 TRINITY_DN10557_c0_g1~~TRINITY_DN10557_c0_g1_i1.p1  ORF type:complete len:245 (+),score=36.02 TRINITY_DN10557_c0_g1_i1:59-793(+)
MSREIVSQEGLRSDGRRAKEIRKIECKMGLFSQCDGSASYEQGNTKMIACVYGPRESKTKSKTLHDRAVVTCEYNVASFSGMQYKKVSKNDRRNKEIALMIKETFETCIQTQLFPRTQISIIIYVLQSDGGVRAAAVNAATLALVDAGIPMNEFICACTAGFADSTPIVDLNMTERAGGSTPEAMVAIEMKSSKMVALQLENKLPLTNFTDVLNLATEGCKSIYAVMKNCIKETVISESLKTRT